MDNDNRDLKQPWGGPVLLLFVVVLVAMVMAALLHLTGTYSLTSIL